MQQVCHNIRFFSVLLLFISITASADEIDVGMKAYNDGDYATAYEILLPLAEHHGYARAMNTLGIMYEQGLGTEKQGAEALKWYKKASLEGNSEGMYNLGVFYAEGNLIPQDLASGMAWIGAAYDHRNKEAFKVAKLLSAKMSDEQLAEASKIRRQINKQIYDSDPVSESTKAALTEPPVETTRLLTTEQIIDFYSDMTVAFEFRESIATEHYRGHSSRKKALKGKKSKVAGAYRDGYYSAKWWVEDDMLCLDYPKIEAFDGCFWIESLGQNEMRTYSQKTGAIGIDRLQVDQ